MIKKSFKYLLLFVIGFVILSVNVNAATQACETGNANGLTCSHEADGYHFSYGGKELFCVSKGLGTPTNIAEQCSIQPISVSGVSAGSGYIDTRNALRGALANAGYAKGNTSSDKSKGVKVKFDGSVNIYESGKVTYEGDNVALVPLTLSTKHKVKLSVKGNGQIVQGNGPYGKGEHNLTLRVTGSFSGVSCDPTKVTIYASYTSSSSEVVSEGGTNWYMIKCGSGIQDFMVEGTVGIPFGDGDTGSSSGSRAYSQPFEISVMPRDCDCEGESNAFCVECNESYKATDTTKNLLACANADAFKKYCGEKGNLKKYENKYCKVYCTEAIEYQLPGRLKTTAGRYFELRKGYELNVSENGEPISIKGTRTCFTNKVNKDLYKTDIEEAQDKVIAKYNEYLKYKAAQAAYSRAPETSTENRDPIVDQKTGRVTGFGCSITYSTVREAYTDFKGKYDNDGTYENKIPQSQTYTYTWISSLSGSSCTGLTVGEPEYKVAELPGKQQEALSAARGLEGNIASISKKYAKCGNWTNNYCFKPEIDFEYDEPYKKDINGKLEYDGDVQNGASTTAYSTTINNPSTYDITNNTTAHEKTQTKYVSVTGSDLGTKPYQVNPKLIYVKKEVTKSVKFKTATKEIVTYHPYGTISVGSCPADEKDNCRSLGYKLPVALQHKSTNDANEGIYNYRIKFKNVGVGGKDDSCDSAAYGRISGEACSLSSVEADNCPTDYSCTYQTKKCDNCEIICECPENNPRCEVIDKVCVWKKCPTCEVECLGCIWEKGDTTISYKPISLTKVYSDKEVPGYNWDTNRYPEVKDVIKRIEDTGESIYDPTQIKTKKVLKESYYKITIDNSVGSYIRNYNAKSSGYTNDTLSCKTTICRSEFLTELQRKFGNKKIELPR